MSVALGLWTDGSGMTDETPAGWAYVLLAVDSDTGEVVKELEGAGRMANGTNNVAELTALVMGLRALVRPTSLTLHADSEYVGKGATEWLPGWRRRGWRRASGRPPDNLVLWQALYAELAKGHRLTFEHVRGHTGIALNERVDKLAGEQRKLAIQEIELGKTVESVTITATVEALEPDKRRDQLRLGGTGPRARLEDYVT